MDADDPIDLAPATALTPTDPRHPAVPITLDELAAQRGVAAEIFDARMTILEVARRRGIRMTHPEDWVLFKAPDGRVTGYLQDCGAERARDVLSVDIYNVADPVKIPSADGKSFMYVQRADGRSRITGQIVESMEGGRESTEDFCRGVSGAALELKVRKATRANLDGNIARELMGLKNVPIGELLAAWEGTDKSTEHCRRGRGFGTQNERHGGTRENEPDVDPPTCTACAPVNGQPVKLKYRPASGSRAAFFGCPNYQKHPDKKIVVDAAEWIAQQQRDAKDRDDAKQQDAELAAREREK